MNKKTLIFCFVLVLLVLAPMVLSAKVVDQSFSGDQGFDIKIPNNNLIKVGTNETFHFHLFNLSNGVPIYNDTTQCHFHLYNDVGGHIYKLENITEIDDAFDFEVKIDGNNFSSEGMYSYIFQCQDHQQELGGFIDIGLEVTADGNETELELPVIIILVVIALIFIVFGFLMLRRKEDD